MRTYSLLPVKKSANVRAFDDRAPVGGGVQALRMRLECSCHIITQQQAANKRVVGGGT